MRASLAWVVPQWIGAKTLPRGCSALWRSRSTASPCAEITRTSSPSAIAVSAGWTARKGSGSCAARLGERPERRHRHEPRAAIGGEEAALGEKPFGALRPCARHRPLHRRQRLVAGIVDLGEAADIEGAAAVILEFGKPHMLAEDVGRGAIGEGPGESQPLRHFGDDPPVGTRLP